MCAWPVALTLAWSALVIGAGGYLAAAVPYYRFVSITLTLVVVPAALLAVRSASRRDALGAWLAVVVVSVSLKVGHFGYYVTEWNYRLSSLGWPALTEQGMMPSDRAYTPTAMRSISYTEHDLQLAALVLRIAQQAARDRGGGLLDRMPFI